MELINEPNLDKDFLLIADKIKKLYKNQAIDETCYSAFTCAKNIVNQKIEGAVVECGVYQGQKISIILETLNLLNEKNKDIFLLDTFKGMTAPLIEDYQVITKKRMIEGDMSASLNSVKNNIYQTNYPKNKIHFLKVDLRNEKNFTNLITQNLALLRLDTDFYDSILACLNVLYPKVNKSGYIIHDDYGHWAGHYKACNEFYKKNNIKPNLIRTSRKERIEVKF